MSKFGKTFERFEFVWSLLHKIIIRCLQCEACTPLPWVPDESFLLRRCDSSPWGRRVSAVVSVSDAASKSVGSLVKGVQHDRVVAASDSILVVVGPEVDSGQPVWTALLCFLQPGRVELTDRGVPDIL